MIKLFVNISCPSSTITVTTKILILVVLSETFIVRWQNLIICKLNYIIWAIKCAYRIVTQLKRDRMHIDCLFLSLYFFSFLRQQDGIWFTSSPRIPFLIICIYDLYGNGIFFLIWAKGVWKRYMATTTIFARTWIPNKRTIGKELSVTSSVKCNQDECATP